MRLSTPFPDSGLPPTPRSQTQPGATLQTEPRLPPHFPDREPTEPLSHSEGLVRLPPRRLRRQVSAAPVHPSSTQRPPVGEQSRPSPRVRFSGTQKTCEFGSRLSTSVHSSVQVPAPDTEDVPGMPGTGPSVQTEAACPADIQGLPRGSNLDLGGRGDGTWQHVRPSSPRAGLEAAPPAQDKQSATAPGAGSRARPRPKGLEQKWGHGTSATGGPVRDPKN